MTNFAPLKTHSLKVIDGLIEKHGIQGPFLDAGCGTGDVSLHLAAKGWQGLAVDSSAPAIHRAKINLRNFPSVRIETEDVMKVSETFRTIISTSVIEHVRDDGALLRHLRQCFTPEGGWLILGVPTNPLQEWRWDDEYYGHYRRYGKTDLAILLSDSGFRMVEFCDYTFPVFWAMRRAYTTFFPRKQPISPVPEQNTAASSLQSAWDMGIFSRMISILPVWPLVSLLQKPFQQGGRGFEAIVVAVTK